MKFRNLRKTGLIFASTPIALGLVASGAVLAQNMTSQQVVSVMAGLAGGSDVILKGTVKGDPSVSCTMYFRGSWIEIASDDIKTGDRTLSIEPAWQVEDYKASNDNVHAVLSSKMQNSLPGTSIHFGSKSISLGVDFAKSENGFTLSIRRDLGGFILGDRSSSIECENLR